MTKQMISIEKKKDALNHFMKITEDEIEKAKHSKNYLESIFHLRNAFLAQASFQAVVSQSVKDK